MIFTIYLSREIIDSQNQVFPWEDSTSPRAIQVVLEFLSAGTAVPVNRHQSNTYVALLRHSN